MRAHRGESPATLSQILASDTVPYKNAFSRVPAASEPAIPLRGIRHCLSRQRLDARSSIGKCSLERCPGVRRCGTLLCDERVRNVETGRAITKTQSEPSRAYALQKGAVAPSIVLPASGSAIWDLQDYRGRAVVIVFYPADWEPVSTDQLRYYNEVLPHVRSLNAELIGVSVDSVWCHEAFTRAERLRFRLLSDAQPRGAVARAYGVYKPREGRSARALFVIDAAGIISWSYVAPPEVNPGVDGMMTALERLVRRPRLQGFQDQDGLV